MDVHMKGWCYFVCVKNLVVLRAPFLEQNEYCCFQTSGLAIYEGHAHEYELSGWDQGWCSKGGVLGVG